MSDKLRECPFCGYAGEDMAWRDKNGKLHLIEHPNTDCILADCRMEGEEAAEVWNHRPTEDRLREKLAEANRKLEMVNRTLNDILEGAPPCSSSK